MRNPVPGLTLTGSSRTRVYAVAVFGCILMVMLWRHHFQFILVLGPSMIPTFSTGDLLLVNKQAYRDHSIARGDIVVAKYNRELIIKRVIGLPGETVELRSGTLYIDSRPVVETYQPSRGSLSIGEGKLSVDRFALLGDNRKLAQSALVHAIVSPEEIIGKVVRSVPFSRILSGMLRISSTGEAIFARGMRFERAHSLWLASDERSR